MKTAVIIPTRNASPDFGLLLERLQSQSLVPDEICIYDTASSNGTVQAAQARGVQVVPVSPAHFNHGATREWARRKTSADIVIFMTQDAIPVDDRLIENLVQPILSGSASISYARQVPRPGAGVFEAFPRSFNYPSQSQLRGIEDARRFGVYTFFSSDSCSAYLNAALDEVGGFRPTLTSEDYLAAARLLRRGHRIAYAADAVVQHSHSYTLIEEFQRYFDTGYVRGENPWVEEAVGQAEGRGKEYFLALLRHLVQEHPWLVPYAVVNTMVKLLGYRAGHRALRAPRWWKKALSSQPYYWDSRHCRTGIWSTEFRFEDLDYPGAAESQPRLRHQKRGPRPLN